MHLTLPVITLLISLLSTSCANKMDTLLRIGGPGGEKQNPVFFIPGQQLAENEIYFTAEVPKGSEYKYELMGGSPRTPRRESLRTRGRERPDRPVPVLGRE